MTVARKARPRLCREFLPETPQGSPTYQTYPAWTRRTKGQKSPGAAPHSTPFFFPHFPHTPHRMWGASVPSSLTPSSQRSSQLCSGQFLLCVFCPSDMGLEMFVGTAAQFTAPVVRKHFAYIPVF